MVQINFEKPPQSYLQEFREGSLIQRREAVQSLATVSSKVTSPYLATTNHPEEPKDSGLENLMGSRPIKSEEESTCIQERSPPAPTAGATAGTKKSMKDGEESSKSPSKRVKIEPGDGEDESAPVSDVDQDTYMQGKKCDKSN